MNDFNKVISFILGLIVVIVFVAILSGRLKIRQNITNLTKGKVVVSPTPTVKTTKTVTITYPTTNNSTANTYTTSKTTATNTTTNSYSAKGTTNQIGGQTINTIPSTGA